MDTGNTGSQVAPGHETPKAPSEAEMGMLHDILKRAANAIALASDLTPKFADLERRVEALTRDLDGMRQRNQDLDDQLQYLRQQRDEAERKAAQLQRELDTAHQDVKVLEGRVETRDHTVASLTDDLNNTKRDRDDAYNQWHQTDEKLTTALAKLAKIEAVHRELFPAMQSTPEPKAAEAVNPAPHPEPSPQPDWKQDQAETSRVQPSQEGHRDWEYPGPNDRF
jgi:chromosome segregation ATPase